MINNIHLTVKRLREFKNYTQAYVASELGISGRAYSKIESGETQITIIRLNDISVVLNVTTHEMLGFDPTNAFNNGPTGGDLTTAASKYPLLTKKLIEQYEERVQHLEGEIAFLRNLVNNNSSQLA